MREQAARIVACCCLYRERFALPSLGLADKRADAYDDIFDFSKHPTTFKKIPSNGGTQCSGDQSHAPPETDY
ncbi:MAG: hypothetical protein WB615_14855 [Candidatus Tumulicola sp.]